MNFEWKGVFPALLTPFTEKDEVDYDLFKKEILLVELQNIHLKIN